MPSYIKLRRRVWYANIPLPEPLRPAYGGKARLEHSLETRDAVVASAKAQQIAARLRLELEALRGSGDATRALEREAYARAREVAPRIAARGRPVHLETPRGEPFTLDPLEVQIDLELEEARDRARAAARRKGEDDEDPDLLPIDDARVSGLIDGQRLLQGKSVKTTAYAPPFSETARLWLADWKLAPRRAPANTAKQYSATASLFAEWWKDRPLAELTAADAAAFVDTLRGLSAGDTRGRRLKSTTVPADVPRLSPATVRRHVATLGAVWKWAQPRLSLKGSNPWATVAPPRKAARPQTYMPWEEADLVRLLVANPPKRRELYELCLVALFSGLRLSEAANLTWSRIREREGFMVFDINEAKTPAGRRCVPVHESLGWLLKRRGEADAPVFASFNPEGPGKSRGDDASRAFGAHKRQRGFTDRERGFHSFRKNFTGALERAGVSHGTMQLLLGHERSLTLGVYNPAGLPMATLAEAVNRVAYAGLPSPAELYPA